MPRDPGISTSAGPELSMACALDAAGMAERRGRYAALSSSIRSSERRPLAFAVVFDDTLDVALLEETLAIERACCPFFGLHWRPETATLTVSVEDASHEPGLEVLAEALDVDQPGGIAGDDSSTSSHDVVADPSISAA